MIPVIFSNAAQEDLREIGDYIAKDNPLRSVTFVSELIDRAESIRFAPNAYPRRDDVQAGLRVAIHGAYLIFFRARFAYIDVMHIVHSARDVRRLFD